MSWFTRFLEEVGLRKKAPEPAAAAPAPAQAVPVAAPAVAASPAAPAMQPMPVTPGPAPAPEFITHLDGSWWYVSKYGAEYGPCTTLADAQTLKAAIAVRDANEAKPSDDVARNGPIPIADATDQLNAAIKWVKYSVPGCSRIDEEIFGGASIDVKRNVQHLEYDLQAAPLAGYQGPYRAQIDAYISAHQNSPMQPPPIVPGPAPTPEFSTHADGSIWWHDPIRGMETGPCATMQDAQRLRDAVIARDANEAAWVGPGFPQTPWPSDDPIAQEFDRLWASGPDGQPRLFTVGQMRAYYWAAMYNPQGFVWFQTHQAALEWHPFGGSRLNMRRWINYSDQEAPDSVYQRDAYAASLIAQTAVKTGD